MDGIGSVVLVLAVIGLYVGWRVWSRRRVGARSAAARTVELTIEPTGVTRVLADGRRESVAWANVTEVEVVVTRVPTADGANSFALIAGDDGSGCLVPLGVGHETVVLAHLARLDGWDIRDWRTALDRRAPSRTTVWTRDSTS